MFCWLICWVLRLLQDFDIPRFAFDWCLTLWCYLFMLVCFALGLVFGFVGYWFSALFMVRFGL